MLCRHAKRVRFAFICSKLVWDFNCYLLRVQLYSSWIIIDIAAVIVGVSIIGSEFSLCLWESKYANLDYVTLVSDWYLFGFCNRVVESKQTKINVYYNVYFKQIN